MGIARIGFILEIPQIVRFGAFAQKRREIEHPWPSLICFRIDQQIFEYKIANIADSLFSIFHLRARREFDIHRHQVTVAVGDQLERQELDKRDGNDKQKCHESKE